MRRSLPRCAPLRLAQPGSDVFQPQFEPDFEEEIMSCRTNCCKKLSLIFALLAMAIAVTPAFGQAGVTTQNCIQNEWNLSQGKSLTCTSSSCSLGCTANDVSIAQVVNTRDITGAQIAQCQ